MFPSHDPGYSAGDSYTTITRMVDVLSTSVSVEKNFKRGTVQKFGIVYEDEFGRKTSVLTHPNLNAQNPWWRDETYSGAASGQAGNIFADIGARFGLISLAHDAPDWAVKYYIMKSLDNGIDFHVSMPLVKNEDLPDVESGLTNPLNGKYFFRGFVVDHNFDTPSVTTAASLGGEEFVYIPLNALQGNAQSYNALKDSSINYTYAQGDRIRFCYTMDTTTEKPLSAEHYVTQNVDLEIVKFYEDLNCAALRVTDFPQNWVDSAATAGTIFDGVFETDNQTGTAEAGSAAVGGLVFEVYRPTRVRNEGFYYELYS